MFDFRDEEFILLWVVQALGTVWSWASSVPYIMLQGIMYGLIWIEDSCSAVGQLVALAIFYAGIVCVCCLGMHVILRTFRWLSGGPRTRRRSRYRGFEQEPLLSRRNVNFPPRPVSQRSMVSSSSGLTYYSHLRGDPRRQSLPGPPPRTPISGVQRPMSGHQRPQSGHQSSLSGYQRPLSGPQYFQPQFPLARSNLNTQPYWRYHPQQPSSLAQARLPQNQQQNHYQAQTPNQHQRVLTWLNDANTADTAGGLTSPTAPFSSYGTLASPGPYGNVPPLPPPAYRARHSITELPSHLFSKNNA